MTLLLLYLAYALLLSVGLSRTGFRAQRSASPATAPPTPGPVATPSRVLVIGATGGTGGALVEQALARGLTVTALVRRRGRLALRHPSLTVLEGDVLDAGAVDAATRGQDAVLSALGHKRWLGPTRILSQGTRNLIVAMERHGVRRLVSVTSLGVGDGAGRLGLYYTLFVIPVILPFYFWDKARQERLVAASGLSWTLVRPGALTDRPASGEVASGARTGSYLWTARVARADVAAFMLDQLQSGAWLRAAPGIAR